jgi:dTDP-4-amino-4,6-dideoxygalactose transaminase
MTEMTWRCDLVPQYRAYQDEINQAIERVLKSGRYVLGENVVAFEREFSAYIGCRYGVGVNSGTDALMLSLSCFDLQPGDEVITTPFTAIPTYSAIRHVGAKPVFVDIDPDTFLIDLNKVEQVLTSKTKAVVPVHLFGNVVDIERLRGIVGPDIFILEDCAQSHGASLRGRKTGALGDISAFSFYPTKNLGAYGDGGIILTDNEEFAERVRLRRMYGMINKDEFVMDGINSRLDELQAAILRVKLKYLDEMNARRAELAALYEDLLDEKYIRPQAVKADMQSVYHVYSALCVEKRDALVAFLEKRNIQTNVYYLMPLNRQKGFLAAFEFSAPLPVAEDVSCRVIALPFYPEIPEETIRLVASYIDQFYQSEGSLL